jgi:DHA2 family multidrug resistance protein
MAEHGLRKLVITITVIAAAIIELIDTSIVNVALNDMSGNLGATLEDVAWVVTSYAIANVIIIPMTSFLAARFGRRKLLHRLDPPVHRGVGCLRERPQHLGAGRL